MNRLERLCDSITSQSGVPRNAQIIIDQPLHPAQTLKTTNFVDFPLYRSDRHELPHSLKTAQASRATVAALPLTL